MIKRGFIFLLVFLVYSLKGGVAQNLPIELINESEFSTEEMYWCIIGARIGDNKLCYVDLTNGELKEADESHNGQITKNGEGYPDYFYPVSSTSISSIPKMHGARIFISIGEKLYLKIIGNGYAGVSLSNPTDPNRGIRHEIIEFTYDDWGYHGNTTRVDQFSYPISMRLTAENGYDKIVGEYVSFDEVFIRFKNSMPSEFSGCVNEESQMIIAPGKVESFPSTYFDAYIAHIWERYKYEDLTFNSEAGSFTGRVQPDGRFIFYRASDNMPAVISRKPSTIEVLEGSGVLAEGVGIDGDASSDAEKTLSKVVQALFCAAVNRHVVEEPNWSKVSRYYLAEPNNFYSKFWHSEGLAYGQLAYGFCYDDVFGQSTLLESPNPIKLYIYMGGGGSDDPSGGNTSGGMANPNVGGMYGCSGSEITLNNDINFNYSFAPSGNSVIVTFEATTPKEGYVPVLQNKTDGMIQEIFGSGTTVSATIIGEPGENVIVTGKWMFAGGDAFTKDFVYAIGSGCSGEVDTENPTTPNNLIASSITNSDVQLSWSESTDNVAVIGYKVYRGSTYLSTVSGLNYSVNGLNSSTNYTFYVSAVDAAGNESDKASVEVFTHVDESEGDNTSCSGESKESIDGSFEDGYSYEFSTSGNDVTVTFELFDTRVGLVAFAFTYNPDFSEVQMEHAGGNKFTKTFENQPYGSTFKIACKFAFAGGLAVTKIFDYIVGDDCISSFVNIDKIKKASIYPNPATSQVTVSVEEDSHIDVYNLSGQVLYSDYITKGESVINVSGFSTGLYIVKIWSDQSSSEMLLNKK